MPMVTELDLALDDSRTLHAYDTGAGGDLVVVWHHGTPNTGAPPRPLFETAERLGIRWVSWDRPGYGGSTPLPDRDVASAAGWTAAVVDALGIDRFAVMGHSGGGPHALACAALLPERVIGAVSVSGPAPFDAGDFDPFTGMAPATAASLRAATQGRAAKARYEASATEGDIGFTTADHAALAGEWGWFEEVVRPAIAAGPGGLIDDDLATVGPWGFDSSAITAPVLLLHGGEDRVIPAAHGEWLARRIPSAALQIFPEDGHISVLRAAPAALAWLRERAG